MAKKKETDMLDDILDLFHGIGEGGARALKFSCIVAVLYPLLGLLAGVGYEPWWRALYIVIGAALFGMFIVYRGRYPEESSWWLFLAITSPLIMIFGALYKPYAIGLGLGIALVPWIVVAIAISLGVLAYSIGGAALSEAELGDAEARFSRTYKGILGFVVWEWIAGLYILKVGPYLTAELGATLLFTAILLLLIEWSWGFGGATGKVIAFFLVIAVFGVTNALIFSEFAEETGFWDTRVWYAIQPFAHMFLLGVLPWMFFVWRKHPFFSPLRLGFGILALLLFFRASMLTVIPVSTQQSVAGVNFAARFLLIDPMVDAWDDIKESRRSARNKAIGAVRKAVREEKIPSPATWAAWRGQLERIGQQFPEFPSPLVQEVGRNILEAQRLLWEGELYNLRERVVSSPSPTREDVDEWRKEIGSIETRYPEFDKEPLVKTVKAKLEEVKIWVKK